jgi:preprotein translocase subunit SecE
MNKKKNSSQTKKKGKNQASPAPVSSLREKINEFRTFLDESKYEMKKVTYPGQKQTLTTCGSVLFIVTIIAIFLGVIDIIFSQILEIFLP